VLDDAGQIDGGLDAGVATADHGHALAFEQRAVAVRTVGDAPVAVLVLAGHADLPPARAGGEITARADSVAPFASSTRCRPPGLAAGIRRSARCRFMMSTSYSRTCSSSARASFGTLGVRHRDQVLDGQRVQHLAAEALRGHAGADALARGVHAAAAPAGPPPTTSTSNGLLARWLPQLALALPASSLARSAPGSCGPDRRARRSATPTAPP
jgi:hypothetical protein